MLYALLCYHDEAEVNSWTKAAGRRGPGQARAW